MTALASKLLVEVVLALLGLTYLDSPHAPIHPPFPTAGLETGWKGGLRSQSPRSKTNSPLSVSRLWGEWQGLR